MASEIIKGMGFHHMALYVSDFDKSLAFYQKLGMKVYTAWGQGSERIALLDTGDEECKVEFDERLVLIECGLMTFVFLMVNGKYPNYMSVIPQDAPYSL